MEPSIHYAQYTLLQLCWVFTKNRIEVFPEHVTDVSDVGILTNPEVIANSCDRPDTVSIKILGVNESKFANQF